MNSDVVVVVGAIGVSNGDGLIVFDGVGERELDRCPRDGDASDGICVTIRCDREARPIYGAISVGGWLQRVPRCR